MREVASSLLDHAAMPVATNAVEDLRQGDRESSSVQFRKGRTESERSPGVETQQTCRSVSKVARQVEVVAVVEECLEGGCRMEGAAADESEGADLVGCTFGTNSTQSQKPSTSAIPLLIKWLGEHSFARLFSVEIMDLYRANCLSGVVPFSGFVTVDCPVSPPPASKVLLPTDVHRLLETTR